MYCCCWVMLPHALFPAFLDAGGHFHTPAGAQVMWGEGATEGGSSGSPLVNADTGKVVGVLTGGFSSCAQPLPDYYGRLSAVRATAHILTSHGPDLSPVLPWVCYLLDNADYA